MGAGRQATYLPLFSFLNLATSSIQAWWMWSYAPTRFSSDSLKASQAIFVPLVWTRMLRCGSLGCGMAYPANSMLGLRDNMYLGFLEGENKIEGSGQSFRQIEVTAGIETLVKLKIDWKLKFIRIRIETTLKQNIICSKNENAYRAEFPSVWSSPLNWNTPLVAAS